MALSGGQFMYQTKLLILLPIEATGQEDTEEAQTRSANNTEATMASGCVTTAAGGLVHHYGNRSYDETLVKPTKSSSLISMNLFLIQALLLQCAEWTLNKIEKTFNGTFQV